MMLLLKCKTAVAVAIAVAMLSLALLSWSDVADAAAVYAVIPTNAHVMPAPNPVGVGQNLIVTFRLDKVTPTATSPYAGDRWQNLVLNIVRPDGTNETRGPFTADATGGTWTLYTPTMVGNYTFQLTFPGQWVNYTSAGVNYTYWYQPSISNPAEGIVMVQQEQVPPYPSVPLPAGYWTRPVYSENKGWWQIADNWLMVGYDYSARTFTISSTFSPYTSAPNSAHVLWTTPVEFGGMVGGKFGDISYYTGLSYEQFYMPIILQGKIIYVDHGPSTTATYGTRCLDLYTGKQLWYLDGVAISFAQVLEIDTPNEHGALPFLWSVSGAATNQTWTMYEANSANTGQPPKPYLTITNVTGASPSRRGGVVFGPNGELLTYYLDNTGHWLSMWNSTLAVLGPPPHSYWNPTYGSVIDGRRGIQWNATIPDFGGPMSISQINGGYILCSNLTGISGSPFPYIQLAFPATLERLPNGSYPTSLAPLWTKIRGVYMASYKFSNVGSGAYVMFDEGTLRYHCYNITTGEEIWVSEPLNTGWGIFTYNSYIAYDRLYSSGFDGHLRCYSIINGSLLWDFYFGSAGYETPYGTWPNYCGFNIADGKVYITNDEHSPDAVRWRGGKLWCIDAYTGKPVWSLSGWLRQGAISDGYFTALNSLDGQAYCIGKGPSATTVSAPQIGVQAGAAILITGAVVDKSPAQPDTPAISDADMGAWMEYLHQQKPFPENATGVKVSVKAIASDGTVYKIGETKTDIGGAFGIDWTPPAPGKYQIMATFPGTNSYGSSYATTYLLVVPAVSPSASPLPSTTAMPSPTTSASPSVSPSVPPATGAGGIDVYIVGAAVTFVAIVIAAAVILKRRKK